MTFSLFYYNVCIGNTMSYKGYIYHRNLIILIEK